MTDKVDFKKSLPSYQARRGTFDVIKVEPTWYLMVDGHGDPNSAPEYAEALKALYPVAYKLKFASKRELGRDYVVPPLEGLWWADDLDSFTSSRDKSQWDWTMMIMTPGWVDEQLVTAAIQQAARSAAPARLTDVRWEPLDEGECVQTLHVGSFDDEGPVLEVLHHEFVPRHGFALTGKHHEIYLSDPRKSAPDKLRTILRQPVTRTVNPPQR